MLELVFFSGPLSSILMSKWSHRQIALFGACLSSVGLICMPFAPNLLYMYVFYGVIAGMYMKWPVKILHNLISFYIALFLIVITCTFGQTVHII